jgi:5,10-methylenetetrahydromethanopterin reductase
VLDDHTMRFGLEIHQYLDAGSCVEEALAAERLGYDAVWFGDSQMIWREAYVLLGAAATQTSRVELGIGVTNPRTRHIGVTASAMLTLQELTGGRALLGVGVGHTSVATIGAPRATRAELAGWVADIRKLFTGNGVGPMRLAWAGLAKAPPILVAAGGPNMLRLAGQIGDGVIIAGQAGQPAGVAAALDHVRAGQRERAEPAGTFDVCLGIAAAVSDDRQQALDAVRPHAAQGLLSPLARLSGAALEARDRLRTTYDAYQHLHPTAAHAGAVPDEVIREFCLAGTPEECAAQAKALFEAGVDEMTIRPYAIPGGSRLEMIERFARDVMGRLR